VGPNAATAGSANTGGGGGGGGRNPSPFPGGSTMNAAAGGSGVIYLIYKRYQA
jgi:hypothetical protein